MVRGVSTGSCWVSSPTVRVSPRRTSAAGPIIASVTRSTGEAEMGRDPPTYFARHVPMSIHQRQRRNSVVLSVRPTGSNMAWPVIRGRGTGSQCTMPHEADSFWPSEKQPFLTGSVRRMMAWGNPSEAGSSSTGYGTTIASLDPSNEVSAALLYRGRLVRIGVDTGSAWWRGRGRLRASLGRSRPVR
ncbi:hypothetical protein BJX76DRAFT_287625 [Aspergillus varians]